MARPRAAAGPDSRSRLLAAATTEFAARGLAGASVDRIARAARLNKAMIYYHFGSKDALYCETIRATLATVGQRVTAVQRTDLAPAEKLAGFVAAFAEEALRAPEFPRVMLREMVEQGAHLDARTVRLLLAVPDAFVAILLEGRAAGAFRHVNPLVAYFALIGPVVLLAASHAARARIARLAGRPLFRGEDVPLVADLQALAAAMLAQASERPAHSQGVPHARPRHPAPAPRPHAADRRAARGRLR
jgi:TetR/AcrR family transcriptional regulator